VACPVLALKGEKDQQVEAKGKSCCWLYKKAIFMSSAGFIARGLA